MAIKIVIYLLFSMVGLRGRSYRICKISVFYQLNSSVTLKKHRNRKKIEKIKDENRNKDLEEKLIFWVSRSRFEAS